MLSYSRGNILKFCFLQRLPNDMCMGIHEHILYVNIYLKFL